MLGGRDAEIGAEESLFQPQPGLGVELGAPIEGLAELGNQAIVGARQSALELLPQASTIGLRSGRGRGKVEPLTHGASS